jgi:hypothetical protein
MTIEKYISPIDSGSAYDNRQQNNDIYDYHRDDEAKWEDDDDDVGGDADGKHESGSVCVAH